MSGDQKDIVWQLREAYRIGPHEAFWTGISVTREEAAAEIERLRKAITDEDGEMEIRRLRMQLIDIYRERNLAIAEVDRLREAVTGFFSAKKVVLSDEHGTFFKALDLTQDCWAEATAALQPKEG
jgi:Zn-finger domain-containing protein